LKLRQPQFPFCVCWANETWTRRWDGDSSDILVDQNHDAATDAAFMRDLLPYLEDERYIRIDGRPQVLVYRVDLFPETRRTAALWRDIAVKAGGGEPCLVQVQTFSITGDPAHNGFDAAVEFPGHQIPKAAITNMDSAAATFKDRGIDYLTYARFMPRRPDPAYRRFRSVMPS
jgi:lipopolysaccharide biosynthesis protein